MTRIIENSVIRIVEDKVVSFDMDYRYSLNIGPVLCLS